MAEQSLIESATLTDEEKDNLGDAGCSPSFWQGVDAGAKAAVAKALWAVVDWQEAKYESYANEARSHDWFRGYMRAAHDLASALVAAGVERPKAT